MVANIGDSTKTFCICCENGSYWTIATSILWHMRILCSNASILAVFGYDYFILSLFKFLSKRTNKVWMIVIYSLLILRWDKRNDVSKLTGLLKDLTTVPLCVSDTCGRILVSATKFFSLISAGGKPSCYH